MSKMKKFIMEVSENMGKDSAIDSTVLKEADKKLKKKTGQSIAISKSQLKRLQANLNDINTRRKK